MVANFRPAFSISSSERRTIQHQIRRWGYRQSKAYGSYVLLEGKKTIATAEMKDGQESVLELPLAAGTRSNSFTLVRRSVAGR